MPMMHPEDEANTDAPLVPELPTHRPTTTTSDRPTRPRTPGRSEPDPLQPHLSAIRGQRSHFTGGRR